MANSQNPADIQRIRALMTQFKLLTGKDQDKRDQILDELQDAVGLAGKMVMENDIIKRAEKVLASS